MADDRRIDDSVEGFARHVAADTARPAAAGDRLFAQALIALHSGGFQHE